MRACYGLLVSHVGLVLLVGTSEGDLTTILKVPDEVTELVFPTAVSDDLDLLLQAVPGGLEPFPCRHFGMFTNDPPELALGDESHQGFDDVEVTRAEEDDHQTTLGEEWSLLPPHPHPHLDVRERHLTRHVSLGEIRKHEDAYLPLLFVPPRIHEIGGVLPDVARRENYHTSPFQLVHLRLQSIGVQVQNP